MIEIISIKTVEKKTNAFLAQSYDYIITLCVYINVQLIMIIAAKRRKFCMYLCMFCLNFNYLSFKPHGNSFKNK